MALSRPRPCAVLPSRCAATMEAATGPHAPSSSPASESAARHLASSSAAGMRRTGGGGATLPECSRAARCFHGAARPTRNATCASSSPTLSWASTLNRGGCRRRPRASMRSDDVEHELAWGVPRNVPRVSLLNRDARAALCFQTGGTNWPTEDRLSRSRRRSVRASEACCYLQRVPRVAQPTTVR